MAPTRQQGALLGYAVIKRTCDVVIAGAVLVIAWPLLLVFAIAILVEDSWPVFYRQTRAGQGRGIYHLLKLRSMRRNDLPADHMGHVGPDHQLVTRTGRVMRRLKIDELPQLVNVLRGDMSLVGPRPTLQSQVERYDAFQVRRLLVRPGMTGWAQVNGNTSLDWNDRILLDVWYVDHVSLKLDLLILWKTLSVIAFGERPNPLNLEVARAHARSLGWGC